jgi:hypothetical protein
MTGSADGSSSGNYFSGDGEYDLVIDAVKHKPDGYNGESVIVELTVLSSNRPDVPPGSSKATAWNLTKHKNMALNNIKSFVCGVYGWQDNDKSPPIVQAVNHVSRRMVEADNPLGGVKVHLSTWTKKTRSGGDFTTQDWKPCGEPGYAAPFPSPSAPAPERYYPEGTSPGRGATHRLVNGAWVGL